MVKELSMVESAETALHEIGFRLCRVRHYGSLAKIEVSPDAFRMLLREDVRAEVVQKLKAIGYLHVVMDLEGYIQGSMNRDIPV